MKNHSNNEKVLLYKSEINTFKRHSMSDRKGQPCNYLKMDTT